MQKEESSLKSHPKTKGQGQETPAHQYAVEIQRSEMEVPHQDTSDRGSVDSFNQRVTLTDYDNIKIPLRDVEENKYQEQERLEVI